VPNDSRKPAAPRWWLNTYFLFGILLFVIAVLGLMRGADYIRDPGQPDNPTLGWWYMLASALFFVNGWVSHQATVQAYLDAKEE
jgi:hypothetical protein